MDLLEGVWRAWFRSKAGHFKAAFHSFATADEFEAQSERLLRDWLAGHVMAGRTVTWPVELKGSPFRGLEPFGASHAAVFFGLHREITKAVDALKTAAEGGVPAMFVVGASGSGKSSLARAGIAPRLMTPGVVPQVDGRRLVTIRPSEHGSAARSLAQRLYGQEALPELASDDGPTPAGLEAVLHHGDEAAARPLDRIGAAMREREEFESPVRMDLVVVVDQLEELFSEPEADCEGFGRLLSAIAATGRIRVVATLRADLHDRLLTSPGLKALKEKAAGFDLGPPGPAELAAIVRGPAQAAGLVYETDAATGETLDERILQDARRMFSRWWSSPCSGSTRNASSGRSNRTC